MALRVDDVDLARDRTLVERFQDGDEAAFGELYRRYYDRLQRFCLKRVGDPVEAEELAQEAFARAYRAMPSLAGERRFYPWLSVIAARLCVDTHRRRARTSPSEDIDLGSVDGGQDAIVASVDVQVLERAMARISERHREILVLREHEGWSYQRIAEHYDVSMGTVEALLFRARKSLRREFFLLAPEDETHGRRAWLVGVPGVAWITRHAASARARFAHLLEPHMAQAIAGGAAAVAFGSMAVVGGMNGPAPASKVPAPTQAVAVTSASVSEPTPAATVSAPGLVVAPPATGSTAPAAAGPGQVTTAPTPQSPLPSVPEGGAEVSRGPQAPTSGPTEGVGGVKLAGDMATYVRNSAASAVAPVIQGQP